MNFSHWQLFNRLKSALCFAPCVALLTGLLLGLLLPFSSSLAHDDDEETLDFEERQACFKKVGSFLSSFLSTDSAKDYWLDIFRRNRCQQNDIFELDEEIDELLIELYETSCEVEEWTDVQNEIREKKMELYFVRHIVEAEEKTYLKKDLDAVDWDLLEDKLLEAMIQRYVKDKKTAWVNEEELTQLFEEWTTNYENRVESYLECKDSPWQEVTDKWRELNETITDIWATFKEDLKEQKDEFDETTKERLKERGILNPNGEFVGVGSAIKSYMKTAFEVNVLNLPTKKDLEDVLGNFEALGEMASTEEAQRALDAEEFEFAQLSRRAELESKYTFLYRQGGGEITTRLVEKITELREVVQISTDGIRQANSSSSGIGNLKQLQAAARGIWKKQGEPSANPS